MLLFFVCAYLSFSAAAPEASQVPALFVAFAALLFLVGAFFQGRRLISRMEMLVADSLDELANSQRHASGGEPAG